MTLRDISKRSGFSISTVSRAINGSPVVKAEVGERIRKIAAEMNYTPNLLGRNLRLNIDPDFGPDFFRRQTQDVREKKAIAAAAARLFPTNTVVALDSGSTASQLGAYLSEDVVIYTNSLAPLQLLSKRGITTHLAPGLYIPEMVAVFGPDTEDYARSHPVGVYFLSAARIDVHKGLFNVNPLTIGVKLAWMQNTRQTVVLADHTKFVDIHVKAFAPLSAVDILVTDYIPHEFRDVVLQQIPQVIEIDRDSEQHSTDGQAGEVK